MCRVFLETALNEINPAALSFTKPIHPVQHDPQVLWSPLSAFPTPQPDHHGTDGRVTMQSINVDFTPVTKVAPDMQSVAAYSSETCGAGGGVREGHWAILVKRVTLKLQAASARPRTRSNDISRSMPQTAPLTGKLAADLRHPIHFIWPRSKLRREYGFRLRIRAICDERLVCNHGRHICSEALSFRSVGLDHRDGRRVGSSSSIWKDRGDRQLPNQPKADAHRTSPSISGSLPEDRLFDSDHGSVFG